MKVLMLTITTSLMMIIELNYFYLLANLTAKGQLQSECVKKIEIKDRIKI
jgi:hypothetical protein